MARDQGFLAVAALNGLRETRAPPGKRWKVLKLVKPIYAVEGYLMRVLAVTWIFLTLWSSATVFNAARSDDDEAVRPWQGTGIDPGFLDDKLNAGSCSQSDREFLSCIGAVQRVLDVEGRELQLIPITNLVDEKDWQKVLERFGAAAIIEDSAMRIGAKGNALEVVRARTHRVLRWRDRLTPSLRQAVDFTAIRNWLKTDVIDAARQETFAAAVNGYLSVADAHARIAPAGRIPGSSGERRGDNPVNSTDALVYTGIGAGVQPTTDAALVTAVVREGPAAQAGLRVHDFILAVDGRSVTGLSGDALVKRLRGRDGTQVALKVKRQDEVMELSVRRKTVRVDYLASHAFVDRGWHLAYLNGLLLDLRDNAGGLIDQAVCVADLLLTENEAVVDSTKRSTALFRIKVCKIRGNRTDSRAPKRLPRSTKTTNTVTAAASAMRWQRSPQVASIA
jgi:hypothetical protein